MSDCDHSGGYRMSKEEAKADAELSFKTLCDVPVDLCGGPNVPNFGTDNWSCPDPRCEERSCDDIAEDDFVTRCDPPLGWSEVDVFSSKQVAAREETLPTPPSGWSVGSLGLCGPEGTAEACEPLCCAYQTFPEAVSSSGFLCPHGEDLCYTCWPEGLLGTEAEWRAYADDLNSALDETDPVNHPPHYNNHPSGVECIEITEAYNFCVGNAMKYLWRAGLKGDAIEDLRKAQYYITREINRKLKEAGECVRFVIYEVNDSGA